VVDGWEIVVLFPAAAKRQDGTHTDTYSTLILVAEFEHEKVEESEVIT
jgi:hypothetical protein